jgi:hypothetical protein
MLLAAFNCAQRINTFFFKKCLPGALDGLRQPKWTGRP